MNTTTASRDLVSQVPAASWQALSGLRVWFGHQSVGGNIVQGISDLAAEGAAPVAPPALVTPADTLIPQGFTHGENGRNTDPHSKIEAFARFVGETIHGDVDIAFFKFCYVDIDRATDVDALAVAYRKAMTGLSEQYPRVRFVHVTCPLTVVTPPWRARLKRVLGRPEPGFAANAARERFNRLLREAYAGREPLFDLAVVESTRPEGSRVSFRHAGETWPSLVPDYSHDGRHLNQAGRQWVAAHLLSQLAALASGAPAGR